MLPSPLISLKRKKNNVSSNKRKKKNLKYMSNFVHSFETEKNSYPRRKFMSCKVWTKLKWNKTSYMREFVPYLVENSGLSVNILNLWIEKHEPHISVKHSGMTVPSISVCFKAIFFIALSIPFEILMQAIKHRNVGKLAEVKQ